MEQVTHIPGIKTSHKVISLACRAQHGDGAIDLALEDIKTSYKQAMRSCVNKKATFHVVLAVDHTGGIDEADH